MEAESSAAVSKFLAVAACTGMSLTYVGLLYAPRFILRLPPPVSFNEYMLRRFFSVAVSSIISLFMATLLLSPVRDSGRTHITSFLSVYGFKLDHLWQAVFFPLSLTAFLYLGPLMAAAVDIIGKQKQEHLLCAHGAVELVNSAYRELVNGIDRALSMRSDVLAWRNYVVHYLGTWFLECLKYIISSEIAHLNHFWELYYQKNYGISRAAATVGLQLGYTVIFGWYASFLFIRTGHLVAPIIAHTFCNIMGLPSLSCIQRGKVTTMVFLGGIAGFFLMLTPLTNPVLYNASIASCKCWQGFCKLKFEL